MPPPGRPRGSDVEAGVDVEVGIDDVVRPLAGLVLHRGRRTGSGKGEPREPAHLPSPRSVVFPTGVIVAAIVVGIPLNWLLGGTRTAVQRIAIAIVSVPATLVLAVALFTFNALVPETYAALLRFADWIWQGSLNALSSWGDTIPGALKLTNVARQGFSGHHYVIMALCSMVASFLVNALFAFVTSSRDGLSTAQLAAAVDRRIAVGRYQGEKTIG